MPKLDLTELAKLEDQLNRYDSHRSPDTEDTLFVGGLINFFRSSLPALREAAGAGPIMAVEFYEGRTGRISKMRLEWAAKWIEDGAAPHSQEVRDFAARMAITIRAEAGSDAKLRGGES